MVCIPTGCLVIVETRGDTVPTNSQGPSKTTETHWATAERLQKEVFSDSSGAMQLGLAPAAGSGRSLEEIRTEWTRARGMGVGLLAAHLHKPERPAALGFMGHRDSGIPHLNETGLLGPDYHVAHANRLTAEELGMLRDTGGKVCATTMGEFPYMAVAHRGPSVQARAAGVATGIGIDTPLVVMQDYFEHIRAAF